MRKQNSNPLFFGFAIYFATFFLTPTYLQAQSSETDITAFSFADHPGEAILTPNIFDIGLTHIDTSPFLALVNSNLGTHYGNQIRLNSSFNELDVSNLEIRFGQGTQKAHRFTVPTGSGPGVADADYTYQGYVDVPFQVWDVDNNKQLMVSFRDQQDDGNFNLIEFNTAVGDEINHSREYLFIHNLDYDATTANSNISLAGGHRFNWIYSIWPYLTTGATFDGSSLPISTLAIEVANSTVDAEVIYGTDLTALVPTITVAANATVSPISGLVNDFTEPKIYKVTAQNGVSFEKYLVHVTFDPNSVAKSDSLSLLALYNSTDGANWSNTWDLSLPISTWYGVTITDGRVTSLDLNNNVLNGTIPLEIGNLTELTYLGLWNNQLSGNIPSEIGFLIELKDLDIGGNPLSGAIPSEIWNLNKLEYLGIYSTDNTGTIPAEIGNLVNLKWLQLLETQISGEIPTEIGNLTKLEKLDMWNNKLTGNLPSELGNLTNLTQLSYSNNLLSGSIPIEIGNLTRLKVLNLRSNQLSGSIPSELGNLTNLTGLYLYENQLTESIPSELGNLINLINLRLDANNLTGSIPTELGNLTNIQSIWLQYNELDGVLPLELGNLTNLYYLNLPGNNFTGSIPSTLENTNMTFLYLGDNNLTGPIPSELGNLINLQDLRIESNDLSGIIPESFGNLSNLNGLIINDNPNLSGSIPQSLIALTLEVFTLQNTGVCEPSNSSYQNWKSSLTTYQASGIVCETTATNIESFSFNEKTGAAIIDLTNHTVAIEVAFATDLTSLVSTFALSSGASAEVAATAQVSGTTANDFTSPVIYTVTAEDDITKQEWTITVSVSLPSNETDILGFSLAEQTGDASIDAINHAIDIEVINGTNMTSLIPTITLSNGASIEPEDQVAQDFTNPVMYTVTAQDGITTEAWTVTVLVAPIDYGLLAWYPFNGNANDESGKGNDGIINGATITHDRFGNANSAYSFDIPNTISTPLDLEADQPFSFSTWVKWNGNIGSFQTILSWWIPGGRVYIDVDPNGQFRFGDDFGATGVNLQPREWVHVSGTDDAQGFIKLYVNGMLVAEENTDTNYDPGPMLIGGKANQSSISEAFSGDIDDIRIYDRVLQSIEILALFTEKNTKANILSFSLTEQTGEASIDEVNHTIDLEVLYGTSVISLIPTLTLSDGASVDPTDAVAQDFTNPVIYTVTAEDATTIQEWVVNVTIEPKAYTDIITFNFSQGSLITDYDGNIYPVIPIGTQLWMADNLKTTSYNEGTSIPLVINNADWASLTTGAYSWYENNEAENKDLFGALYNWYSVETGKICPIGWRVPTDEEWSTLGNFLGGDAVAGGKMKMTGTQYWNPPNVDATNESGFNGLPGQGRTVDGQFPLRGADGDWWSSTEKDPLTAFPRNLAAYNGSLNIEPNGSPKEFGFSIRCLQAPTDNMVTLVVPYGTDITSLVPAITLSAGATVQPASGVAQDFTNPLTYTVTADNGITMQDWVITVLIAPNTETDILSFSLTEQTGEASIDAVNHTVNIEVINETNLTSLIPTLTLSDGANVNPGDQVAQDFTNPVTYTVTAEDGSTSADWIIIVSEELVLGIEGEINNAKIYPNPTSDELIINIAEFEMKETLEISIMDLSGRKFSSTSQKGSKEVRIDVRQMNPGQYLLLLRQGNQQQVFRFIKE